jgi:hypothetical protein
LFAFFFFFFFFFVVVPPKTGFMDEQAREVAELQRALAAHGAQSRVALSAVVGLCNARLGPAGDTDAPPRAELGALASFAQAGTALATPAARACDAAADRAEVEIAACEGAAGDAARAARQLAAAVREAKALDRPAGTGGVRMAARDLEIVAAALDAQASARRTILVSVRDEPKSKLSVLVTLWEADARGFGNPEARAARERIDAALAGVR